MKHAIISLVAVSLLVSGLFAQQEPRFRDGENFTYAALECIGPYTKMLQKIGELMAEAQKQNLMLTGTPVVVFYNTPEQVKPEELKWDVCAPMDASAAVKAPLKKGEYKYAKVAEMIFKGPYGNSGSAYPKLMQFIARNGYAVGGPICETYMDDPNSVKPEDCRTLIVVPVRKK